MHDPRGGGHGLALSYAMSLRGACHVNDPMLFMEMGMVQWPELDFEVELFPTTDEHKSWAAVLAMEKGSVENSACWCVFANGDISLTDWVGMSKT